MHFLDDLNCLAIEENFVTKTSPQEVVDNMSTNGTFSQTQEPSVINFLWFSPNDKIERLV